MLPLLLSIVKLLLESMCRRDLNEAPDSKECSQSRHNPTCPTVRWIAPGRNHPASYGDRAEYNPRHRVRKSLTVQKAKTQKSKQETKQGNRPHRMRREQIVRGEFCTLSSFICMTLRKKKSFVQN